MADIREISFHTYCEAVKDSEEKFFKKMTRGLKDDNCQDIIKAFFVDDKPVAFIATKHIRDYANLKWIATLPEARGKGAFRALCEDAVFTAWQNGCKYFRVSINAPALAAYEKVGFQAIGEQRGNCFLSAGKIGGPTVAAMEWIVDERIWKWANQKPRGGCTVLYIDPPQNNQTTLF